MINRRSAIFDWQPYHKSPGDYSCQMAFNYAPVQLVVCSPDDTGRYVYYMEWIDDDAEVDEGLVIDEGYADTFEEAKKWAELMWLEARMK